MENAVSQQLLSLSDAQLAMVDRALTDLEIQLFQPAAIDGDGQHEGAPVIPSALIRQSCARSGLAKLDPVRKRLQRLQRLAHQAREAEATLVNDALNFRAYVLLDATMPLPSPDPIVADAGPTQLLPA